jgi:NADH-quinone oxidoreductase subunit J
MEMAIFLVCAAVAILFALVVVLHPDPIRSVLALVVTFFALAILYVQLSAPLIAALQIVVYAGAILVLFLFVIMLLNVGRVAQESKRPKGLRGVLALVVAGGLGILIGKKLWLAQASTGPAGEFSPERLAEVGSVRAVGRLLFDHHLFAFEFVSVLLLAALVGAIAMTRKEKA